MQPVAVRSSIDVFGENKRLVVEIDSPEFGTVVYVIIAAVQVGSITMTTKEGQAVSKVMPPSLLCPVLRRLKTYLLQKGLGMSDMHICSKVVSVPGKAAACLCPTTDFKAAE